MDASKEREISNQKEIQTHARADGPFEVHEKVSDSAYKVDLPGDYGVSCTFNIADLKPYHEDDQLENLRANFLLEGEDDAPMDGTNDHEEAKASNQTPKTLNQELKDVILIFGSPQTVVDDHGQTVVRSASPRVLDPEMGQLCWILSLATGLGWRRFWYSPKA